MKTFYFLYKISKIPSSSEKPMNNSWWFVKKTQDWREIGKEKERWLWKVKSEKEEIEEKEEGMVEILQISSWLLSYLIVLNAP